MPQACAHLYHQRQNLTFVAMVHQVKNIYGRPYNLPIFKIIVSPCPQYSSCENVTAIFFVKIVVLGLRICQNYHKRGLRLIGHARDSFITFRQTEKPQKERSHSSHE